MLAAAELAKIVRGTVVRVDLSDGIGKEQNKVRPAVVLRTHDHETETDAVVVSSDLLNKRLVTLIVVPISGLKGKKAFKHEVEIEAGEGGLTERSVAQPIQIRTIDREKRVVAILGQLSSTTMTRISTSLFGILGGF